MTDAEIVEKTGGPSSLLIAARERLGYSQKEVADKLYLSTSFIKYLDAAEFDRIPKPAFVKGYLRSYARIVELSGDEIVALYEAELKASEPTPEMKGLTEEKVGTASITGPVVQTGLVGLTGLVGIIALVWWLVSDSPSNTANRSSLDAPIVTSPERSEAFDYVLDGVDSTAEQQEDVGEITDELPGDGESQGELQGAPPPSTAPSNDFTAELTASISVEPGFPGASDEQSAGEVLSARINDVDAANEETGISSEVRFEKLQDGERTYITVDAGGFDEVEMRFTGDCWVEVEENEYGLVYNDLNHENDVLMVYGTRPFKILLGKATRVEMIYNGRPFDLAPYVASDETAKLTVSD